MTAIVIAFSGLVLVMARGRDTDSGAVALWGLAMLLGAAGISLLALETTQGETAHRAGNITILVGTACSWTAARLFGGRRPMPWLILAGPALWLAASLLIGRGSPQALLFLACVTGALYTLATAWELSRLDAMPGRSRQGAILLLVLHAGFYLLRALGLLLMTETTWLTDREIMLAMMLEALLHTLGMAFMFLALSKERTQHRSVTRLRELALLDGLTGIGNRRQFDVALARETELGQRDDMPLALLMIDVDHFKAFNDVYGHQAGDDCLRAIAGAIQAAARRPGDIAVRYGGEEFAVLLPRAEEEGGMVVAELIHARMRELAIPHAGSPQGRVTVSIGTAALPPALLSGRGEALVAAADHALYAAKAAGRNRAWMASQLAAAQAALRPPEPRSPEPRRAEAAASLSRRAG
ncbi:diguanylate cyclase [Roseomonas sp. 18066]|uniref:diguanylate cyclase n=1 Tax=Roseomonas sp. 18066 TaxID=2681412 RepID=UPI00135944FD|nr:diguanylate cyclase [Roseomonas sp. 18066]